MFLVLVIIYVFAFANKKKFFTLKKEVFFVFYCTFYDLWDFKKQHFCNLTIATFHKV